MLANLTPYLQEIDGFICSPHEIKVVRKIAGKNFIIVTPGIRPVNFDIPLASTKIHGITNEIANQEGIDIQNVLHQFNQALESYYKLKRQYEDQIQKEISKLRTNTNLTTKEKRDKFFLYALFDARVCT